ncbi:MULTISPECIES: aminodeoxychorismate lyase [Silvimonas]|uniref:aminodeoxychorismate lyase n=1 Tax=Silvimonas TaxID=300264 RepID=UPI0024B3AF11|nr:MULTISPECIES: aminodeoxychorismate lyase [Silvimonas]MDR3426824.1 aminodeoxychorismate lyase [Silvimonas sp.]
MTMRLINGVPAERLNVADRAFQFGDGVFRTLFLKDGVIPFLGRHLTKLRADAHALDIPAPDDELWLADIRACDVTEATFKLILTRGETPRGYAYPADLAPNRLVQCTPPPVPRRFGESGATVRLCETPAGWQPRLAGIKHLNRLENVLARAEWQDPDIFEGLLLDRDGCVLEGTMTNLLMLEAGRLVTPLLESGGVAGVMRQVALEAAQALGWSSAQERIALPRLLAAERVWLCNSLIGVVPVGTLEQARWEAHPADEVLTQAIAQMASQESIPL